MVNSFINLGYVKANDTCNDFMGKYVIYGEWLRSNLNLKVPQHAEGCKIEEELRFYFW